MFRRKDNDPITPGESGGEQTFARPQPQPQPEMPRRQPDIPARPNSAAPAAQPQTSATIVSPAPADTPATLGDAQGKRLIVGQGISIGERVPIPDYLVPDDAKVEIEAKKAAGYYTPDTPPDAAVLAATKGRGLGDY